MEHGESPLLSLSLQHRSRVGVVVQSSVSHLQEFTGWSKFIMFQVQNKMCSQQLFPFSNKCALRTTNKSSWIWLCIQHMTYFENFRPQGAPTQAIDTTYMRPCLGYLYQDRFSHLHLNLTITNATGTLSGKVTGNAASQVKLYCIKKLEYMKHKV